MAIKLQLGTLRRNVVRRHRKVGRGPRVGRFTFRKSEHQARHSQFAHWLSRWPAGLVRDRSGPSSIRRERSNKNQTSKGLIVLGKDASVGWFVSGYVRLLQSQYELKSARTVLKIISQNLADKWRTRMEPRRPPVCKILLPRWYRAPRLPCVLAGHKTSAP